MSCVPQLSGSWSGLNMLCMGKVLLHLPGQVRQAVDCGLIQPGIEAQCSPSLLAEIVWVVPDQ